MIIYNCVLQSGQNGKVRIEPNFPEKGIFRRGNYLNLTRGNGAEGGTRTRIGRPTRPSTVRVYQFHHFGSTMNYGASNYKLLCHFKTSLSASIP